MIRVFLADSHTIFRQGLRAVLEEAEDLTFGGEAADGPTAVREVLRARPDVVVLDIALPLLNGIEVIRQIRQQHPEIQGLILSIQADEESLRESFGAGARGFLLKGSAARELGEALRTVGRGQPFLSPALSALGLRADWPRGPGPKTPSSPPPLTAREREVLQLIAEGHTNPQIARLLSISIKTVETHRLNLMKKLDIHDVAGLVKYAIRQGLTSLQ